MTRDLETKLDQAYRAPVVVAVAMVASVLMYAGVVEFLRWLAPLAETPAAVGLLRPIFRGLALVTFLAVAWLGTRAAQSEGGPPARLGPLRARAVNTR